MPKPQFVYVMYLDTTPEKLWNALVDGEATRKYWDHLNVSDWKPGSRWEHQQAESRKVDIVGKVVESARPSRLVMTWARPADEAEAAKHSRVTFEIAQLPGKVRLTVTHDQFEQDSKMLQSISEGWPKVLSSLKSWLETGKALPTWT